MSNVTKTPPLCDAALDYSYGMLDGEEKARFEAHLSGCASCQAELEGMGRVRAVAKEALPLVEPTERLTGALHAQLLHTAAQRKPKGKLIPFARRIISHPGYAAAASLLVIGGVLGLQWSRNALLMPAAKHDSAPVATPAVAPPPPATVATGPITGEAAPAGNADSVAARDPAAGKPGEQKVALGQQQPSKDQPFAVTVAEPANGAKAGDSRSGATGKLEADRDKRFDGKASDKRPKESGDSLDDLMASRDEIAHGAPSAEKSIAQAPSRAAPKPKADVASSSGNDYGAQARARGAQASAPSVAAPPSPIVAQAPTTPQAPAKKSVAGPTSGWRDGDAAEDRQAQQRRPPADEPPAPPPQVTVNKNRADDRAGGAGGMGSSANQGTLGRALEEESTAQRELAKGEGRSTTDAIDAERQRANQLASSGRCDEAASLFESLVRRTPDRVSAQDRLAYTRCLRQLGRLDPAQGELDHLRNNRLQFSLPDATLKAEQRAIDMDRKRSGSESPVNAAPAPAERAAKAKKPRPATNSVDLEAPAAKPSNKADTKRAY